MISHIGVGEEGFSGDPLALRMPQASMTKLKFSRAPCHRAAKLQVLEPMGNRRSMSSMCLPQIGEKPWKYAATRQPLYQPNKAGGTPEVSGEPSEQW